MVTNLARLKQELEQLPAEELLDVSQLVQDLLGRRELVAGKDDSPPATGYGWAKGLITVPPDFDEPLEDFRGYME